MALIRKTSLLRIVPTACGQAADKAPLRDLVAPRLEVVAHRDHVSDARRLRIDRDAVLRPSLGAILPLHDVKYRA